MKYAIFDLDHTLLPLDTGDTWTLRVIDCLPDAIREARRDEAKAFHRGYIEGSFDIEAYMLFQMELLKSLPRRELDNLRQAFVEKEVFPRVPDSALRLLSSARARGFTVVIATGTHRYIAEPIARFLGVEHLVAATPELTDTGAFTGAIVGSHSYQEGKLILVKAFLEAQTQRGLAPQGLEAYSDSINDAPLLTWVHEAGGRSVVVNGDDKLKALATKYHWETLEIFEKCH